MFGSILPSAITKLAIVVLRSAVVQELVLIDRRRSFKAWIFPCGKHQVCVCKQKGSKWNSVEGLMLEEVIVFVKNKDDDCLDDEVD